jgi:hypothetical protein
MVMHACNPSTLEAETEDHKLGLLSKILSQNKERKQRRKGGGRDRDGKRYPMPPMTKVSEPVSGNASSGIEPVRSAQGQGQALSWALSHAHSRELGRDRHGRERTPNHRVQSIPKAQKPGCLPGKRFHPFLSTLLKYLPSTSFVLGALC